MKWIALNHEEWLSLIELKLSKGWRRISVDQARQSRKQILWRPDHTLMECDQYCLEDVA